MASDPEPQEVIYVPLAGTRSQSIQRLQIGLAGLGAMALLVGLATVIKDRAQQTEAAAVPEAAANAGSSTSPAANDPLADAGVAPDVSVTPKPRPMLTLGPGDDPPPPKN
jgi:hypothetical protein